MFIVENRHRVPRGGKEATNLLEEETSRVEFLSLFVRSVVAVFADDEHSVHC